ncbi:MAG: hypothetical protein EXR64_05935 [Dehalococcoidia bacterium]|nr:hypothetical protein [Dehalococcoidia bacterium]
MIGRMMQVGRVVAVVLVAGLLGMIPAIASAQAASATVVVEAVDFGFNPGVQTMTPGAVTFAVKNTGTRFPHEIIVIKSDLEPKALPLVAGKADEATLSIVGRMARVTQAAPVGILNLNLPTGRYLVICNIGTHYAQGMTFSLVSGAAGAPSALVPPGIPAPAAPAAPPGAPAAPGAQQASPAPAKTGTGGPLAADPTSGTAAIALGMLALGFVAVARAWTSRAR